MYRICLLCILCLAGCKGNEGDPMADDLAQYVIVFARNNTVLNASGGTKRSLYRISGDGSNIIDLSKHPAGGYPSGSPGYDWNPVYSPSGLFISFQSTREGDDEIYRMNADGSQVMNLSVSPLHDEDLRWSSDGSRIVFARLVSNTYQVFVMNNDGSPQRNLTGTSKDSRYPDWSPDGTRIVYSVHDSTGSSSFWQLYVMNSDGSNQSAFTDSTESAVFPRWSKDGGRIFYTVIGVGMAYRDVSGSGHASLPQVFGQFLSFSPDGNQFVVSGLRIVNNDLMDVTPFTVSGDQPSWSWDGKWIVFRRAGANGSANLFVMQPDGTNERQITTSQFGDMNPVWKP